MLFKRTVLLAVLLSLAVCDLCAFDFSYGPFFTVKGIENKKGKILLPLSRGEYANIRILTAEIHQFLASCKEDCSFDITFSYEEWEEQFGKMLEDFRKKWEL